MEDSFMIISQQKITPKISDLLAIFTSNHNQNILKRWIPKNNHYWTGSGRESLTQILLNLNIKNVGVPAYTCHVVTDAVKRAGKNVVYYDSGVIANIKDIKKNIKKIDALIVSYNFGFMPDMDQIVKLCKKNKIILIEDCAQALGATYKDKLAGSFGDYAFYSFGISKNIGFCGGLIASNKKLKITNLKPYPFKKLATLILKIIIAPIFFNRMVYPFTSKLLTQELKKKQENLPYFLPKIAKKIILRQLWQYNSILKTRRKNANYLIKKLKGTMKFVNPLPKTNPSWLYLVIYGNEDFRKKMLMKNVEFGRMLTFKALDSKKENAEFSEKNVLTIALYRNPVEMRYIIKRLKNE
jgi:dTDP-4-amino-4,6-dideoxygalactose transaminase